MTGTPNPEQTHMGWWFLFPPFGTLSDFLLLLPLPVGLTRCLKEPACRVGLFWGPVVVVWFQEGCLAC